MNQFKKYTTNKHATTHHSPPCALNIESGLPTLMWRCLHFPVSHYQTIWFNFSTPSWDHTVLFLDWLNFQLSIIQSTHRSTFSKLLNRIQQIQITSGNTLYPAFFITTFNRLHFQRCLIDSYLQLMKHSNIYKTQSLIS